jgi:hypothetical protein
LIETVKDQILETDENVVLIYINNPLRLIYLLCCVRSLR